jgi:hypothetical protein
LGAELAEGYVADNPGRDSTLVRLVPERWFSVDYAKFEMPS